MLWSGLTINFESILQTGHCNFFRWRERYAALLQEGGAHAGALVGVESQQAAAQPSQQHNYKYLTGANYHLSVINTMATVDGHAAN
jgi:hypothetical protein